MRLHLWTILFLLFSSSLLAQSDRGTITGTVSDPAGAVVPNAPIEIRNVDTSAAYQAASTATGNYTLAQIPTGNYEMTVTVAGFKKFIRQNIALQVAQTLRLDVALEVGASTESVTVSAEVTLLKTESGELSHNVTSNSLDNLPVLGIGAAGGTGLRNPYAVLNVLPGADFRPDSSIRVNGMPSNTQALRIEGQESGTGIWVTQSWSQPSVDAIQEFAVQTSNYSAEFGQAGGGVFNLTMKSGTNQYHGTAYDYFVNEALNAGQPYTSDGSGHLLRPRQRRNDYGFTLGGPVWIPKIYNGHDRTFFFFNFEQFRENQVINNVPYTLPTARYRTGDFSQALTSRSFGTDPLGRPILENAVYDPTTDRIEGGIRERDPYPNNVIPFSALDPIALKIQSFIPAPQNGNLTSNYTPVFTNPRRSRVPSVKIDQSLGSRMKLSGYWSETKEFTPANDGLPFPITSARGTDVSTPSVRLNFDYTVTPTLLFHLGAGYLSARYLEVVGQYDVQKELGLNGTHAPYFPTIQGLNTAQGGYGASAAGALRMGPSTQIEIQNVKPTVNTSLTWVRNNHTYKAGGEFGTDGYINTSNTYATPWISFVAAETSNPAINGYPNANLVGFPYASFLLGRADNGYSSVPNRSRLGKHSFSWFIQDSWKVTRKLTLDYGLRYDFQSYLREHSGYQANLSPTTPNPTAGGLPGGTIFEGTGPGKCNCDFAHNYPYAYGPRLGAAYQITPKTVVRAGIGVSYSRTAANNFQSYAVGGNTPYGPAPYGDASFILQSGLPYPVTFPNFDPGQLPYRGIPASTLNFFDQNAGRPARTIQWSIGIQREIIRDVLVEATYVANRGVWWQANYMANDNAITPERLKAFGLDINNADDRTLLTSTLNSQLAISRGFGNPPYPLFPLSQTVAQSLRPYPEYTAILRLWNPVGDTWYNSLQTKLTKRFSHGLDINSSFTWAKQENIGAEGEVSFSAITPPVNDVFNRKLQKYLSGFDQPYLLVISGTYTTPKIGGNKWASWAARDWQIGGLLRYGSGLPIMAPVATNNLNAILFRGSGPGQSGGTPANRVPGIPLFTQDLNCHCFDPNKTFVLNPDAWTQPAAGQFGTSAYYYNDYRYQRRPVENVALGRTFRIKEKATLMIRAEFTNIFNRAQINNPTSTNASATRAINAATGQNTAGFGYINTLVQPLNANPRQGTLVARFQF